MNGVDIAFWNITFLIVFVVIILIFRWLVLWYWKINKIVSLLEEQNELLKNQVNKNNN